VIGLTPRQAQALAFIDAHTLGKGYPPTLREVSNSMGMGSTNGASDHIVALVHKGMLRKAPMISRGLVLTAEGLDYLEQQNLRAISPEKNGGIVRAKSKPNRKLQAKLRELLDEGSHAVVSETLGVGREVLAKYLADMPLHELTLRGIEAILESQPEAKRSP